MSETTLIWPAAGLARATGKAGSAGSASMLAAIICATCIIIVWASYMRHDMSKPVQSASDDFPP
jgi:hypothetical protein